MAIHGYKLRINGGLFKNHLIDVGLNYQHKLEGLDPRTEYKVEIAGYDKRGARATKWAKAVCVTTKMGPSGK